MPKASTRSTKLALRLAYLVSTPDVPSRSERGRSKTRQGRRLRTACKRISAGSHILEGIV
ncbi:hypothetical protein AZE42_00940 [Rhizopogon vesiculosus]|uniref:Uncharacterized protein n=1 Tax=Rhizopogon vesiculosus TaxID=180088 RepID=A0A1J8Q130_9AGAM|nr:hypothetical protein AZE42_00940 [Rhizopogon vesiculosus]